MVAMSDDEFMSKFFHLLERRDEKLVQNFRNSLNLNEKKDTPLTPKYITKQKIADKLGVTTKTVDQSYRKKKNFPKPINNNNKPLLWLESDINNFFTQNSTKC